MMILDARRVAAWLLAAIACGAMAACQSDDPADKTNVGAPNQPINDHAPSGTVKQQVAATVAAFEADYKAGDGNGYCGALTEAGQDEVADYARMVGQGTTCADFIQEASRKVRELGITQKASRVQSVRASGKKATAMISIDGKPPRPTAFAKVDGQWKLVSSGLTVAAP
jgi:hypothetical protein